MNFNSATARGIDGFFCIRGFVLPESWCYNGVALALVTGNREEVQGKPERRADPEDKRRKAGRTSSRVDT